MHRRVKDAVDVDVRQNAQQQRNKIAEPVLFQQRGKHVTVKRVVVVQQTVQIDIAQQRRAVGGGHDQTHAMHVLAQASALVFIDLHQRAEQCPALADRGKVHGFAAVLRFCGLDQIIQFVCDLIDVAEGGIGEEIEIFHARLRRVIVQGNGFQRKFTVVL